MRLTLIPIALLLSPLALATPNLVAESNNALIKRSPLPMRPLVARQSSAYILARSPQDDDEVVCDSDEKRCGSACVNEEYNCCPDDANGGCPSDEECQRDNGVWGCCPEGEDCRWDDDNNDDDNDDDDDDRDIFDRIGDGVDDIGDEIEDGWNDIVNDDDDDAAGMLKPGVGVALMAAVVAAVLPA
ncbi:uncharacterized protein BDW70DRAFT_160193 [Aspergillus foveolatus]|uniref:uncharacterized protein n=1 Tax=Aspergillus foveolatus TaxID=210207 RepID=UPI003CCDDAF7